MKIKNKFNLWSTLGLVIYGVIVITSSCAKEAEGNNEDYYAILQPGIHPNAPLGHPEYVPKNVANLVAKETTDLQSANNINNQDSTKEQSYYSALKEEAFQKLLNVKIPLTPEQVIKFNKELDKNQRAVNTNPNIPPEPISSTVTIDLSPGSTPPVIRLATGFVSSLIFIDATGQPWPIADYSLGNPTEVNIQWDKKTNALFVQSTASYVTANLAVRLAKLATPVMISLVTGQKQVDYRVDFQVSGRGPNALPAVSEAINPQFNLSPALLKVLDGIPPAKSKELQVSNNLGRAWVANGKMILRTNLAVLSPAWNATVASADGTKVYEFNQTPLILASKDGKTIKIEISGF